MKSAPFTNDLIDESSPYLLQHAHNPVNWHAWNEQTWNKARIENKLVLISIGYSSCHWCHVMEHETFENEASAKLMNENFICIKVDREERPDVDHVYMSAVQLMTGHGGWPLNCFCLPDGKPVYGGTYFQKQQWDSVLIQLADLYHKDPAKTKAYADELTQGIAKMELVTLKGGEIQFSKELLATTVENWKKYFDHEEGGPNRAPKFPMPNNYEFLLNYAAATKDNELRDYVLLTLDKMAFGGIYDHLGGGFARYSTDTEWKVPHFEKMLYDNAQLVSLYAHAYQLTKNELYKKVACETLEFIGREMTSAEGGCYSALDADSEGVEGKFYVWKKDDLEKILGGSFALFAEYYNVNDKGYWEHDHYILLRKESDEVVARKNKITVHQLQEFISDAKKKLLSERDKRIHPGLDDKQLTSWNGLMITGYCNAWEAFGEKKFLDAALRNAEHILSNVERKDGGLNHSYKNGKAAINGYLEDYAFIIEAFLKLYEATFDEKFLSAARQFCDYALSHFYDAQTGMFFFTSDLDQKLIARKKEIHDNVIPAPNSAMAKVLFLLGKYFDDKKYMEISRTMLNNVQDEIHRYGSSFSNWCDLMMWNVFPFYEIVITGEASEEKRKELAQHFLPRKIMAGTKNDSVKLALFENRVETGKTWIYVCENYSCRLPVIGVEDALSMLR